jgi:hypothetical protein
VTTQTIQTIQNEVYQGLMAMQTIQFSIQNHPIHPEPSKNGAVSALGQKKSPELN